MASKISAKVRSYANNELYMVVLVPALAKLVFIHLAIVNVVYLLDDV